MQAMTPQAISVDIYDQMYQLRGVEPQHIQYLATIVDEKMRTVAKVGSTVDSLRVAVLAALNIADELEQMRRRLDDLTGEVTVTESTIRHRADSLNDLLDEVLMERIAV